MFRLLYYILAILASQFKSKSRLEAENAAFRHQLIVLQRKPHGRMWLTNSGRWFFIQMYRLFPSFLNAIGHQQRLAPCGARTTRAGIQMKIRGALNPRSLGRTYI